MLNVSCCAGQSATLTLDMQIFGSAVLPFTTTNQGIITQGVATFLNSGVTASQIVLTVENTIAGVRHTPDCLVDSQDMRFVTLQACQRQALMVSVSIFAWHVGEISLGHMQTACRQFAKVVLECCIKNKSSLDLLLMSLPLFYADMPSKQAAKKHYLCCMLLAASSL